MAEHTGQQTTVLFYDCSLLSENVTSIIQIRVAYVETLSFREVSRRTHWYGLTSC